MYAAESHARVEGKYLREDDVEELVRFADESRSQKLSISGGGEPFVEFSTIERLVRRVHVPRIEIVTAGNWAVSESRAQERIARLATAAAANPSRPQLLLRISVDSYHASAPNPVGKTEYLNLIEAWRTMKRPFQIGFRSIVDEREPVLALLVELIGGHVVEATPITALVVSAEDGEIPVTFNVFRHSGRARSLKRPASGDMRSYYASASNAPASLPLGRVINDAIVGSYADSDGVAITVDADMSAWIFCATAPDRFIRPLSGWSFGDAVQFFGQDPITRVSLRHGIWRIADIVSGFDEHAVHRAESMNDVTRLPMAFFRDSVVLAKARLEAARILYREGELIGGGPSAMSAFAA
jgi:hypothetical protein